MTDIKIDIFFYSFPNTLQNYLRGTYYTIFILKVIQEASFNADLCLEINSQELTDYFESVLTNESFYFYSYFSRIFSTILRKLIMLYRK